MNDHSSILNSLRPSGSYCSNNSVVPTYHKVGGLNPGVHLTFFTLSAVTRHVFCTALLIYLMFIVIGPSHNMTKVGDDSKSNPSHSNMRPIFIAN